MAVDDSETILFLLEKVLSDEFEVVTCDNAEKALELIDETFDAIILDIMMPVMDGLQFLETIRGNETFAHTPVIILTAKNDTEEEIARIFSLGANDYINKPFLRAELIARVKVHIKLKNLTRDLLVANEKLTEQYEELQSYLKREELLNEKNLEKTVALKEANRKIKSLNRRLKYLATHDKLTKIHNRRSFLSYLEKDMQRAKRTGNHLSMLMFDIDYFKKVNDTYGHLAGDAVLHELAELIKNSIREVDILGRYGGEEFLIILPDTDKEEAVVLGERILDLVREMKVETEKKTISITISIGITCFKKGDTIETFIERVDKALYKAKNDGRDNLKIE
jgi:diguanylate cyclase (GGDEF)-like protein